MIFFFPFTLGKRLLKYFMIVDVKQNTNKSFYFRTTRSVSCLKVSALIVNRDWEFPDLSRLIFSYNL